MTIAASLPSTTLDIRGDRLRFSLANAINECEQEYRNAGTSSKAASLGALLTAVQAKLTALTAPGTITLGNVSGDNTVTAAEAASAIPVAGTTSNANGKSVAVLIDGLQVATGTVSANAYSVSVPSATWLGLSLAAHTVTAQYTDDAGFLRAASRTVTRSA